MTGLRTLAIFILTLLPVAGCSVLHENMPVWGEPSGLQAKAFFWYTPESRDIRNLDSADPELRRWAVIHIMQRGDQSQMPRVRVMIDRQQEPYPLNRAIAAEAARVLDDRASLNILIAAIDDPANYVRRQVVRSVGYLGTKDEGPIVARVLTNDSDEDVRLQAVDSLVQLEQRAAIPDLIVALEDRSQSVRFAAHISLVTLTGTDRGFSRQLWLKWLRELGQA
jgi:hypothetical protein